MTRYLLTTDPSAAHSAKNTTAPGLPNQSAKDSKGRTPMVGASNLVTFDEQAREHLHTTGERYPFAYGWLSGAVASVLDGTSDLARLRAVLDALDSALGSDAR